jgi:hypothetical protein
MKKTIILTIIHNHLSKLGVQCNINGVYKNDINNDNFKLWIETCKNYSYFNKEEPDFSISNIFIETVSYSILRRRIRNFDIEKGDYQKLVDKIQEVIAANQKAKVIEKQKESRQVLFQKEMEEKLKPFNPKKEKYGDTLYIKTPFLEFEFDAYDNGINCSIRTEDLSFEKGIELIKKLK